MFDAVFDQSPIAMIISAPDGTWLRVNGKLGDLLGYDDLQSHVFGFSDIIHYKDMGALHDHFGQLRNGETTNQTYNVSLICRNGSHVTSPISTVPIYDDNGAVLNFLTTINPTQAQVAASQETIVPKQIDQSQATWLQAIFEHAPMEMVIKDVDGRIVAISGDVASDMGDEPEDFIGGTTADYNPDHIADIYMAADRAVIESGEPLQQVVVENAHGTIRYSLSAKFPIRDDAGSIIGIGSMTSDITDLKQSEEALRATQETLEQLVEDRTQELREKEQNLLEAQKIGHIGSYVFDHVENRLISFSHEYARIHGLSEEEIDIPMNLNVDHLTHAEDWERVEATYNASWKNKESFEVEYRIIHPSGEVRHILEIGELVENTDKATTQLRGIVQDVTERSLLDKAKNEFISTVSHELRTPLTSIKGALGLIRSGVTGKLPKETSSMLDIAYNNSDRLVLLINDLLDIEKIEAGQVDYTLKTLNVADLISDSIQANKGYGDTHNVSFVQTTVDDDLIIAADQERLMHVLSNLMSNAVKFSPEGETVTLSATRKDSTVCIAVADNGMGIPEDFRNVIFEKFTQADSSDSRRIGGTGLGLNIVQAIVNRHGGTVRFDTEINVGTTFYVDLPLLADQTSCPTP